MKDRNKYARGARDYARRRPIKPPSGRSFLIVTEGEKTEPNYFTALRDRLKLSSVDVEIVHPEGTDPVTLTEYAIRQRDARKKSAKDGDHVEYDEVWVVLDLEKPHDIRREQAKRATQLKSATEITFAQSDPSFEYWLILHFEYTTAPLDSSAAAEARLRRSWPEYEKCCTPRSDVLDRTPAAVTNSKRCRRHHESSGGDGNPFTEVDLLVCNLNGATRPFLRFPLEADASGGKRSSGKRDARTPEL